MNFFGLVFAFSCLGSLLYSVSLFRLPNLWAEGFLVKTAANLNSFAGNVTGYFDQVDQSVFQNPARLLTHSAIALSHTPAVRVPQLSLSSPLQQGNQSQAGFTRLSVRPTTKFLQPELIPVYNPRGKLISTYADLQSAVILTNWSEQNQTPMTAYRLRNIFGSSTTSLILPPGWIEYGHSLLPQKQATRTQPELVVPIQVIRVRQGQQPKAGWFQVWVNHAQVAEFLDQTQADLMAKQLRQILRRSSASASPFDWDSLQPARTNGLSSGKAGSTLLFVISKSLTESLNRSSDLIAIDWVNHLRVALNGKALSLVEAQTRMYGLVESEERLKGTASWYGPYFHGRLTATGEIFNQDDLTAAHPSLPFNTFLKVTNLVNGQSVIVRVNDRGPYVGNRSLDLSRAAAHSLESEAVGVISYSALIMKPVSDPAVSKLRLHPQ